MSPEAYLSDRRERRLVHVLQAAMAGIIVIALINRAYGLVVNASVGLAVTFLPALLERNYQFTVGIGIVLWITNAMFLHALGVLSLPFIGSAYATTWWWDHMTHALSSSLVAGVAYVILTALDEHTEFIHMPTKLLFTFMLMFILAFGVLWELLEFYIGLVAEWAGFDSVLTQYGLKDTVLDLFYTFLGGLAVAMFGVTRLSDVSNELAEWLDSWSANH